MFPHDVLFPYFLFWRHRAPDACGVALCCARSPLRPFPQFMSAGFTGFTLTPLTSALRPPTATHPLSTNQLPITTCSRAVSASIGPILLHLCFLIGNMLPPARLFWILFLLFFPSFLCSWFTQLRLDLAVKSGYTSDPGFCWTPVFPRAAVYRGFCSACRPLLQTR